MKNDNTSQSSSANLRVASAKFILTGLIAAAASFALPASSHAQLSAFPFTIDGQFTGSSLPGGNFQLGPEWSDVTPTAFHSVAGQTAFSVPLGSALANTLLYAAIGNDANNPGGSPSLHLMYDFLPRTSFPLIGETIAKITFPVTLPGNAQPSTISVFFTGSGPGAVGTQTGNVKVGVDTNNDGVVDGSDIATGIIGATQAGPSTLSNSFHLLAEIEVPLRIPTTFGDGPLNPGGPAGGHGIDPATGLYSPEPQFWGAAGAGNNSFPLSGFLNGVLQSASAATLEILPSGSTSVTPTLTPEPSSAVLLLGSLGMLAARRRKAA